MTLGWRFLEASAIQTGGNQTYQRYHFLARESQNTGAPLFGAAEVDASLVACFNPCFLKGHEPNVGWQLLAAWITLAQSWAVSARFACRGVIALKDSPPGPGNHRPRVVRDDLELCRADKCIMGVYVLFLLVTYTMLLELLCLLRSDFSAYWAPFMMKVCQILNRGDPQENMFSSLTRRCSGNFETATRALLLTTTPLKKPPRGRRPEPAHQGGQESKEMVGVGDKVRIPSTSGRQRG